MHIKFIWRRSCRPDIWIPRRYVKKIRRISNLLKSFKVRTLSNSNANFVTSLIVGPVSCILLAVLQCELDRDCMVLILDDAELECVMWRMHDQCGCLPRDHAGGHSFVQPGTPDHQPPAWSPCRYCCSATVDIYTVIATFCDVIVSITVIIITEVFAYYHYFLRCCRVRVLFRRMCPPVRAVTYLLLAYMLMQLNMNANTRFLWRCLQVTLYTVCLLYTSPSPRD